MWPYRPDNENRRCTVIFGKAPPRKRRKESVVLQYFTCGWMSGGSVGVAASPCPSVSDCASSSSTSWMVGVTSDGGREVFFFFRFFLRLLSALCTLLRTRWGRGRWVDKGWCVWWNVCLWSGLNKNQKETKGTSGYWMLKLLNTTEFLVFALPYSD